jgi:TonB family protein
MDSTDISVELEERQSLAEAIGEFARGAVSLESVRDRIVEELTSHNSTGSEIHNILDSEFKARRLSFQAYKKLVEGINAALPGTAGADGPSSRIPAAKPKPQNLSAESADSRPESAATGEKPAVGVGTVLRDRFRLDQEVASGSMGVVYRATDLMKMEAQATDPSLAIKVLSREVVSKKDALKTFQNEIANTQLLSHPNIVRLFELDKDGENYFITMEWLDGESLDAVLDRSQGSALPDVQTYAIIEQLCDALSYAHGRGVIHADIKPGNVFLVKTGELKLIDFGIAQVEAMSALKNDAGNAAVALTPAYASCERFEAQTPTAQDDLYSLACMIYRLLSGRRVFSAMNALEAEQSGVEPVAIGGMSDSRWAALRKALSFRRADRQTSVAEFAEEFGQRGEERDELIDDEAFTETTALEDLPDDFLNPDEQLLEEQLLEDIAQVTRAEAQSATAQMKESAVDEDELFAHVDIGTGQLPELDETHEMSDLMEEPENLVPVADGAHQPSALDQSMNNTVSGSTTVDLHETTQLKELAGAEANTEVMPASQPQTLPAADLDRDKNRLHVDTERLNSMPNLEIADATAADNIALPTAVDEVEVPFVDTINLNQQVMPEPINIVDGDGSGFLPEQDPAAAITVPVEDVRPQQPAAPAPQSSAKQPAARDTSEHWPTEKHQASVTLQLSGGGQKQVQPVPEPWFANLASRLSANFASWLKIVEWRPLALPVGVVTGLGVLIAIGTSVLIGDEPAVVAQSATQRPLAQSAPVVAPAPAPEFKAAEGAVAEGAVPLGEVAALEQPVVADGFAPAVADPLADALPAAESVAGAEQVPRQPEELRVRAQPQVGPEQQKYLLKLEQRAVRAISDGRLTKPANDSAVYWVDQMRAEGAPEDQLAQIEPELSKRLVAEAEKAFIAGELETARAMTDYAQQFGATEMQLTPLRASISKLERDQTEAVRKLRSAPAAKPQAPVEQSSTVALSELTFVRYVEPRYPTGANNEVLEGWVDVAFLVDKDGKTSSIKVTGSNLPEAFIGPSVAAVKRWRFEPHIPAGLPVAVRSGVRLRYDN